jgi:radical SAM protein (TIGR01212 family)
MTLRIRRRRCQHCRKSGDGAHQCRYLDLVRDHAAAVDRLAARIGSDYPFLRYSDYLLEVHGAKTYRVGVDAGFTCPVRETTLPCSFCDARGSRAPYLGHRTHIRDQVSNGIRFLTQRYGASKFLLYFQAFSNTHAPVAQLRATYSAGLDAGEFEGLIVSTRPDCVDEPRADLLAEFAAFTEVWVELGLQSANDRTLRRIRRGHSVAEFNRAVRLLQSRGLRVAVHLILGLPGETHAI